jgi:hypothetical protein
MQRQRALADSAFARAHGDEMTHSGEPISDAAALPGNLLEDSGSSVADDVMVALHFCEYGADSLQERSLHLKIREAEGAGQWRFRLLLLCSRSCS